MVWFDSLPCVVCGTLVDTSEEVLMGDLVFHPKCCEDYLADFSNELREIQGDPEGVQL